MTTAFVLGGGGLLGAHEVGMLRALAAAGVRPDLVVGTSIGALNGVLVAAVADRPSVLRGIHHIERGYHRPFEQFGSLGLTIRRG